MVSSTAFRESLRSYRIFLLLQAISKNTIRLINMGQTFESDPYANPNFFTISYSKLI
jgi:hypothetical protein